MKKKFIILILLATIFMACSSDDDGAVIPPVEQEVNVVLSEVEYLGSSVEIQNVGTEAVDVSGFFLCLGPGTYNQISALNVVSGANNKFNLENF